MQFSLQISFKQDGCYLTKTLFDNLGLDSRNISTVRISSNTYSRVNTYEFFNHLKNSIIQEYIPLEGTNRSRTPLTETFSSFIHNRHFTVYNEKLTGLEYEDSVIHSYDDITKLWIEMNPQSRGQFRAHINSDIFSVVSRDSDTKDLLFAMPGDWNSLTVPVYLYRKVKPALIFMFNKAY